MKIETPIFLSDSVALLPGERKAFSVAKLQPVTREAYFIDSVRFLCAKMSLMHLLRTSIRVGRSSVTQDFVPIWSLGPSIRQQSSKITFEWKLPRPLLVLPGEAPTIAVERLADVFAAGSTSATVTVALVGRYASELPSSRVIPYIMAYSTSFVSSGYLVSGEQFLINNVDKPVDVRRIVGRVSRARYYASPPALDLEELYSGHNLSATELPVAFKMEAQSRRAAGLFPDLVPFWSVFDPLYGSTDVSFTLAPGDGFVATVSAPTGCVGSNKVAASVALVASRQETI